MTPDSKSVRRWTITVYAGPEPEKITLSGSEVTAYPPMSEMAKHMKTVEVVEASAFDRIVAEKDAEIARLELVAKAAVEVIKDRDQVIERLRASEERLLMALMEMKGTLTTKLQESILNEAIEQHEKGKGG